MRCDRINGNNGWQIDRERAIEVAPVDLIEKAAETSDCAIITFGRVFGEGKDRNYHYNYLLSKDENRLLDEVSRAFHAKGKKVNVILNIGGYIDVWSWQKKADGIVLCWLPGQEGGNAVASVLSGKVNPSGHLPSTMSKDYWQEPSADNFPILYADKPFNYSFYRQLDGRVRDLIKDIDYTEYKEGIYVGYRYFNTFNRKAIAYPFGHGLSYTDFEYGDIRLSSKKIRDGKITVKVPVTNVGKVAGSEVVQVYVHDCEASVEMPQKQLKGFDKVYLEPGETKVVSIELGPEAFRFFDEESMAWKTEPGDFEILIGSASDNIAKTVTVAL